MKDEKLLAIRDKKLPSLNKKFAKRKAQQVPKGYGTSIIAIFVSVSIHMFSHIFLFNINSLDM